MKIKIHRNAFAIVLLVMQFLLGSNSLKAQETMANFIKGIDTLVVYKNVPGLAPSNKYSIRVKSAATNNEWVDVFANYTYNRNNELPQDKFLFGGQVNYHYQRKTTGWSHSYGNIEMSKNTNIDVEISYKEGFQFNGEPITKAVVHPTRVISKAPEVNNGKVYFSINNPGQIYIDINGQMDDYHFVTKPLGKTTEKPNGIEMHAISLFANPTIKKPSLDDPNVVAVEPGTPPPSNLGTKTTLYFKPGVHNIGMNFKLYPNKNYYIPGDAIIYGTMNNLGVPDVGDVKAGQNIKVYGYGTISHYGIPHPDYATPVPAEYNEHCPIYIEDAINTEVYGLTIVDPSFHSIKLVDWTGRLNKLKKETYCRWNKIISWRTNGDGIGSAGLVEDCFLRTTDDASYIKGNRIRCIFWRDIHAAGFHMAGTTTTDKSFPLLIEDCDVIYLRSIDTEGFNGGMFHQRAEGDVGQQQIYVTVRNVRCHDPLANSPFFNMYSDRVYTAKPRLVGSSFKGITFQNIEITANNIKQILTGCTESPWYGGLIFDNVTIGGVKITADNYKEYFVTNEYTKYLLWAMPKDVTLTTNADASKGSVTRNLEQSTYLETTPVTLTAIGKSGYVFSHWSGDYTGTDNPATVVVDKNMTITANFSDPDFSKPLIYTAPETGSFTIPANVTKMTVECWGGGGAGGSVEVLNIARAGGGSGGNYSLSTISVQGGDVINYSVGAGGVGSLSGFANNSNSGSGGDSYAKLNGTDVVIARGGKGGINKTASGTAASVTSPTDNLGATIFLGGNGGNAAGVGTIGSGGGGSSAGPNSNGNNGAILTGGAAVTGGGAGGTGTNSNGTLATAGAKPGGGGAGTVMINSTVVTYRQGASGGNGKIIFNFTLSPNSLENATALNAKISAYPNPVSDILNLSHYQGATIRIYDITGVLQFTKRSTGTSTSIDVTKFKQNGILLAHVISGNQTKVLKIICNN